MENFVLCVLFCFCLFGWVFLPQQKKWLRGQKQINKQKRGPGPQSHNKEVNSANSLHTASGENIVQHLGFTLMRPRAENPVKESLSDPDPRKLRDNKYVFRGHSICSNLLHSVRKRIQSVTKATL